MKDDNKPNLFIYILLIVVFVVLIASCGGGGGGGGGGMVAFAPDNNMPNNGGDAGGWGTGTDTGGGGIGGSSIQEENATLLLGQSAALSYQKVDIDLVVNGEHFAINNVTATTTTEVLPNIPLGATVSGTATIYLINGTTRTALLEMTEIGIHNNLVFKVPYNYTCVDASSVAEITSGTYFSRDGIDLSSFTNHPIIGWKCQEDGSVHAGGYITGVRGDITLEPLFDTGVTYNITYVSPITSQSVPDDTYTSAASKTLPVLSESNLTFAGWYDNQSYNGQPVATIPLGTTGDKTYYAKWTATVTFYKNNGTNTVYTTQNDIDYGGYATAPSNPSWTDHRFLGWYADSACTTEFNCTTQQIMQDTPVYADWIVSFSGSGEKGIRYESGKTNYDVELNGFQNVAPRDYASFTINNNTPGAVMNVNLIINGTNKSVGDNHGGLKVTSGTGYPGGTINIVFTTTSSGTLELGFKRFSSHDIQVENVTANFSVDPNCTISDMKVGDTTYTDFNSFINDATTVTDSSIRASFTITRN